MNPVCCHIISPCVVPHRYPSYPARRILIWEDSKRYADKKNFADYLIESVLSMLLSGKTKYISLASGSPAPKGITVNFSPKERRLVVDSLAQYRESLVSSSPEKPLADL